MIRYLIHVLLVLGVAVCAYASVPFGSAIPDPGDLGVFYVNHIYHATLNDTFPTSLLSRTGSPSLESYTLRPCVRKDNGTCLRWGKSLSQKLIVYLNNYSVNIQH